MKAFRFPLDRALQVRRTQFEVEQAHLQRTNAELNRVNDAGRSLLNFGTDTRRWIAGSDQPDSTPLSTVPDFQRHMKGLMLRLERQKNDLAIKIAAQQRKTMEAQQRVKLLEKLRGKRLAGWQVMEQREQENFATEAFLSRWTPPK